MTVIWTTYLPCLFKLSELLGAYCLKTPPDDLTFPDTASKCWELLVYQWGLCLLSRNPCGPVCHQQLHLCLEMIPEDRLKGCCGASTEAPQYWNLAFVFWGDAIKSFFSLNTYPPLFRTGMINFELAPDAYTGSHFTLRIISNLVVPSPNVLSI